MKKNVLGLALVGLCVLAALAALVAPAAALDTQGACCMPDGSCQEILESACKEVFGATWMGPLTSCADSPCGPVGGVTEPRAGSVIVLPAMAMAAMIAAGTVAILVVNRRTT